MQILRPFKRRRKVLVKRLDDSTWILVPKDSGSSIVVVDLGDSILIRAGIGMNIKMAYERDPEEEDPYETFRHILTALTKGHAAEFFVDSAEGQIVSYGFKAEYPSGWMVTHPPDDGREYRAWLPAWNA